MQFDDPKRALEAAAARPSRDLDAPALVRRGKRMRRTRLAAGAAGLAIAVGVASASFGFLRGRDGRGPDPAAVDCAGQGLVASVYLREDADDDDVRTLGDRLRKLPGVVSVEHVSQEESIARLRELEELPDDPFEAPPDGAVPASFRVEVEAAGYLGTIVDVTSPAIDEVALGPHAGHPACVAQSICGRPPSLAAAIYLRDDARRRDVRVLESTLASSEDVAGFEYFSKADAYREFRKLYEDQPEIWENLPRNALPASFRVEAADAAAVARLSELESPAIDEIVHSVGLHDRFCADMAPERAPQADETHAPSPAPRETGAPSGAATVPPPVLGKAYGDHVNDVLVTADEAECDATPSWKGAPRPRSNTRWCRFKVTIDNLSQESFDFETVQQLLQTTQPTHIYRPRQRDTGASAAVEDLFDGAVEPGESGGGWLVYGIRAGEEPQFLTLTAPGFGAASADARWFGCRETLAADGARCTYSSDRAFLPFRYRQSVELYHCGVKPFEFAGRRWVSDPPPFDATNAPGDFTGSGTIELVTEREAVYVDSSGAEIELRADEEWEPPPCL